MAVIIRDQHLEEQIDEERQRRGDGTMAKTLGDLVRERLMQLTVERSRPALIHASKSESD